MNAKANPPNTKPRSRPKADPASRAQKGRSGNNAQTNNAAGAKRPAKPTEAQSVSYLHGAEALAALTVAESKLSRFKGRVVLGLTLLLMFSLAWNSIQSVTRPEPKLLATTTDGRIRPLPLLDAPIDSRQTLLDWTRRNIPKLYSFNYVNFRSQLNKALDFTRPVTLESFQESLTKSGILTKVRNEFLILRATIANEPVILNEQVIQGRRVWTIEIPMNLIYDSGDVKNGQRQRITQPILFTAWIARANPLEYDGGLMLAKYSVKTRRN